MSIGWGKATEAVVSAAKREAPGGVDRFKYAIRMFGRNAVRRELAANATDADKVKYLLDRENDRNQIDDQERVVRSRRLVQRSTAEAQRNMMRSGGSINAAQDAFRAREEAGW